MKYHQRARAIYQSTLAPTERFVLLAVSDHLGSNEDCWPSLPRLATMTGLNERTIRRSLSSLEQAGHITVTRKPGRANRYRVIWEALPTLDNMSTPSPRTESHPGHNVQGTPDTVSTPLDTESTEADQEAEKVNGSITPPTPQGAVDNSGGGQVSTPEPVDKSTKSAEKVEPTAKKRKSSKALTVEEVCAIPLPIDLQSLEGYAEAFQRWCEVRKGSSWRRQAAQVERFHQKMAKAYADGKDVLAGLEKAYESGYQGLNPKWLGERQPDPTEPTPQASTDESADAWGRVLKALRLYGPTPPGVGAEPWVFSNDPATAARYEGALIAAAEEAESLPASWRMLYHHGDDESRVWQARRFRGAFRRAAANNRRFERGAA